MSSLKNKEFGKNANCQVQEIMDRIEKIGRLTVQQNMSKSKLKVIPALVYQTIRCMDTYKKGFTLFSYFYFYFNLCLKFHYKVFIIDCACPNTCLKWRNDLPHSTVIEGSKIPVLLMTKYVYGIAAGNSITLLS